MRLMQAIVDSLMTQYIRKGTGKTVLILHGWGDTSQGLKALSDKLSQHYEVVALDLPGFGGTQSPHAVWGLTEYATFVQHFAAKVGLADVYAYIGHSNGGAIAIRGLGQGILRADKLVLIASAGIRGEYNGRNKLLRVLTKAGKAATTPLPKSVKTKLRRKVYDAVGSDMLVAEHLQETFKKVVTDDVRQDAQQVKIPALLLYGENDQATPPRYGEQYHQLLQTSTLEVVGGAGHFVHIDKPEIVEKAVEEFLR